MLEPFSAALATALEARGDDLVREGQLMPGAAEAVAAVAKLDGTVVRPCSPAAASRAPC